MKRAAFIVGIGASAGGLDACKAFFRNMPAGHGMAFVVISHLAPTHESLIAEILQPLTTMQVLQVTTPVVAERDRIYVIAPDTELRISGGILTPIARAEAHGVHAPIDGFFSSLAADLQQRAVAIVLSGTGNDGAHGLQDVAAAGGLCLVQAPDTAEHDGMPRSAIATRVVDHVAPVQELPQLLIEHATRPHPPREPDQPLAAYVGPGLADVLELLGRTHGLDFRAYKVATLRRRTERRMGFLQIREPSEYFAHLQTHPEELAALYADLLIGVTQFFRDPELWKHLEKVVVPEMLADAAHRGQLRIWVPGCASGEEAYSLAMVLLDHMEGLPIRPALQIFATDVDEAALIRGRRGLYPQSIRADVSPERLRKYFRPHAESLQITQSVREIVTFAKHNALSDPPFSRQDLVSCRNLLIYLRRDFQTRLFDTLHFALRPGGVLVLGNAETIGRRTDLFEPISKECRTYRALPVPRRARHALPLQWRGATAGLGTVAEAGIADGKNDGKVATLVQRFVLDHHAPAAVVVDSSHQILYFFGPIHDYLIQPTGQARLELSSWTRPGLYPRLRSALQDVIANRRPVTIADILMERGDELRRVEATIEPIGGAEQLLFVRFRDALEASIGPLTIEKPAQAIVLQLEDESRLLRRELQDAIGQVENAEEQHRAREEELLSLNEELQSSNEELETSKEELQSLNEEIGTVNRELVERNGELRSLYADLDGLLVSTGVPAIFLDGDLRIRRFTPAAVQVMRLASSDVGRHIEDIKPRYGDDSTMADLDAPSPVTRELRTEDGRWFVRRVTPHRDSDNRFEGATITFSDITEQKRDAANIEEGRAFLEAIVQTIRTPLLVLDAEFRIVSTNDCFYDTFHVSPQETVGRVLFSLGNHQWDIPALRELLERILPEQHVISNFLVEHEFEHIGLRHMLVNAHIMVRPGRPNAILVAIEDVTARRQAEATAVRRTLELEQEHRRKDEFLAMLGHELRNPLSALVHGIELLANISDDARRAQVRLMMERQAHRMTALLDQLLEASRVMSGKIALSTKQVDLRDIVRAAIEAVAPVLEARRHEVSLNLPQDAVTVMGDSLRLTQVLTNLLTNAAKYMEDEGQIEVSIDASEHQARITVHDTGIGIDPDLLPRIFDLFTQGRRSMDRSEGGLGLGLPIVRSLVEMHGGTVRAESPGLGKGSDFVVTLPRVSPCEQPATVPRPIDVPPGRAPRRRILVVDDEADIADSLAMILEQRGHQVCPVHDGRAALEAVDSFRPDVVLLDLGLPDMDGYEVARRLRAERYDHPVRLIALTGYQRDDVRLEQAGFDAHLLKPIDPADLTKLLAAP